MTLDQNQAPQAAAPNPPMMAEEVTEISPDVVRMMRKIGISKASDGFGAAKCFFETSLEETLSDEEVADMIRDMHRAKTLKKFFRALGYFRASGVGAILGTAYFEALLARGWANTLFGILGIAGRVTLTGLCIYLGIGWRRSRALAREAKAMEDFSAAVDAVSEVAEELAA